MKILNLTLKKQWFDMILSGEKTEEYREIKEYWNKRLLENSFDVILFSNGYGSNVPKILIELKGIQIGFGNKQWGAPDEKVYILSLGEILETRNLMT